MFNLRAVLYEMCG